MATIEVTYLGEYRSEATHTQSGTSILTDAPTDNHGKGEAFSPTDLVATALGTCMMTIMGQAAERLCLDIKGTRITIDKIMASDPRRIARIDVDFYLPGNYTDKERKILERAADTCPVAKSLHPELLQNITFHYGE